MSNTIRLTQEFYQKRRDATDTTNPQEIIEVNHVGWASIASQLKAFETATDLSWINWQQVSTVLDVGCGYGRLLDFLASKKAYIGEYLGIDIVPEFIEKAIRIHAVNPKKPESQFLVGDFLAQDFTYRKFDVAISLGGLSVNHDYPDQPGKKSMEYAHRLISKVVHISGLAISLYFPNASHIAPSDRKPRMAYYEDTEIEAMLLEACGKRCKDIAFISYPGRKDMKTIAQVRLSK